MSLLTAIVAALFAMYRTKMFWCDARSLPLATALRTAGFSLDQMPNLEGKVALVTGANTGIGLEVSMQLVLANATVVMACRDSGKCDKAVHAVTEAASAKACSGSARGMVLDLSDLVQVDAACDTLIGEIMKGDAKALHILVNNAGIATQVPHTLTTDNIEITFQVNYLGHFHFTQRLLPMLRAARPRESYRPGGKRGGTAPRSSVVHLSSGAHRGAPTEGVPLSLEQLNDPGSMNAYARYGMSKLANLAFSRELALREKNLIVSNAVHPGVVATEMLRRANFHGMLGGTLGDAVFYLAQLRNALFAYSSPTAALSVLHPAVAPYMENGPAASDDLHFDPVAKNVSGQFYVPIATRWEPHHSKAHDPAFGEALWDFASALVSTQLERRAGSFEQ
jgi:NAD(P)-dependent dehydrogenase (short-subunit alcohol dehydrogenase family)